MNVFLPIIDALERIARGDFSVRLENEFQDNQMVGKLASSVNKMALELDQMENMRQEFISNVSHEIQSPLTSIRGFAQALENDQLTSRGTASLSWTLSKMKARAFRALPKICSSWPRLN